MCCTNIVINHSIPKQTINFINIKTLMHSTVTYRLNTSDWVKTDLLCQYKGCSSDDYNIRLWLQCNLCVNELTDLLAYWFMCCHRHHVVSWGKKQNTFFKGPFRTIYHFCTLIWINLTDTHCLCLRLILSHTGFTLCKP